MKYNEGGTRSPAARGGDGGSIVVESDSWFMPPLLQTIGA